MSINSYFRAKILSSNVLKYDLFHSLIVFCQFRIRMSTFKQIKLETESFFPWIQATLPTQTVNYMLNIAF